VPPHPNLTLVSCSSPEGCGSIELATVGEAICYAPQTRRPRRRPPACCRAPAPQIGAHQLHKGCIADLHSHPAGLMATAGSDGLLALWDCPLLASTVPGQHAAALCHAFTTHCPPGMVSCRIDDAGSMLASSDAYGTVRRAAAGRTLARCPAWALPRGHAALAGAEIFRALAESCLARAVAHPHWWPSLAAGCGACRASSRCSRCTWAPTARWPGPRTRPRCWSVPRAACLGRWTWQGGGGRPPRGTASTCPQSF
jgi:hypothetical protein